MRDMEQQAIADCRLQEWARAVAGAEQITLTNKLKANCFAQQFANSKNRKCAHNLRFETSLGAFCVRLFVCCCFSALFKHSFFLFSIRRASELSSTFIAFDVVIFPGNVRPRRLCIPLSSFRYDYFSSYMNVSAFFFCLISTCISTDRWHVLTLTIRIL